MFVCKDCNDVIEIYSGFGVCRCSTKPLQIIVGENPLPDDQQLNELIKGRKLLNLRKSRIIKKFMEEAAKLFLKYHPEFHIPEKDLPYIVGLGDILSFLSWIKEGNEVPLQPQAYIVPKLFDKYYTGVWFLYKDRIQYQSIHPLGYAFNIPHITRSSTILLYQNIKTALQDFIDNYSPSLGYPSILAHHKLNLTKNFFWLSGDIKVVYSELTPEIQEQLAKTSYAAISENEIKEVKSWKAKVGKAKLRAKRIPPRDYSFVFTKKLKAKIVQNEWYSLKGQLLLNFDIRLAEVRKWKDREMFVGFIYHTGKPVIRFGTEYKDVKFTEFVEETCKRSGFYPYIHPSIRKILLETLIITEPTITVLEEPYFGILSKELRLPLVRINQNGTLLDAYYGIDIDFTLTTKDFQNLKLTNEELQLANHLLSVFKEAKNNRKKTVTLYHPNTQLARFILRRCGIAERERCPGFGRWVYLDEHVIISNDKKYPPIPGLIRESKVLAYLISQLYLQNRTTTHDTHEEPV